MSSIDPNEGMVWFDDEKRKPTAVKIAEAVERFHAKHPDRVATGVLVNEADQDVLVPGLVIRASRNIQKNYLWVLGERRSRITADQTEAIR